MAKLSVPNAGNPFKTAVVAGASFTIGDEDSNAITVNVQLKDQYGDDLEERTTVKWWLFGDANGDTLATAISTGVTAGTDGWVKEVTAGQHGFAGCESDGDLDLVLTKSSGAQTVYLGIDMPDGSRAISGAITFA